MRKAIRWTDQQDFTIKRMRAEGSSWELIAQAVGICRWTVIKRGNLIGAKLPPPDFVPDVDPNRPSLPPGHPDTWGAMIANSCLAGMAYPATVSL